MVKNVVFRRILPSLERGKQIARNFKKSTFYKILATLVWECASTQEWAQILLTRSDHS